MRPLALLLFLSFFSLAGIASTSSVNPTINIFAEGKVKASPDMATLALSIQTVSNEAKDAHQQADSIVRKLQLKLKAFEIREGSLDTSQTTIYPDYDYNQKPKQLLGYRANRQVSFDLLNLKQIDKLMDAISGLENLSINNTQFTVKDKRALEDQALINAINLAKQKAELIAKQFNVGLGKIDKVTHQTSQHSPPVYARAMTMEVDMAKASTYEQQDIEISTTIDVAFQIQ